MADPKLMHAVQDSSYDGGASTSKVFDSEHPYLSQAMADSDLMHAVQYDSYGGGASALKYVKIPVPKPKKDELLLKVEAVGVNPLDWKIQRGIMRPFMPSKFPYIPGTDVAGVVVQVGAEVSTFSVGDEVVTRLDLKTGGGFAQFAVAPSKATVKRPAGVSAERGCGLPIAGLTALQAIRDIAGIKLDGSSNDKNLLITAAGGGAGTYAVQIAKLGGAHVTATCIGRKDVELLKRLGADEVNIDYRTPEADALRSPSGRLYDAVIHCATNIPFSKFSPHLKPVAKVIDLTPRSNAIVSALFKKLISAKRQLVPFMARHEPEDLAYLIDLLQQRQLKTIIDSKYPLESAGDAWARSASRAVTGKVVVTVDH